MKKRDSIKFGLLGLGTVVKARVSNVFLKEIKNAKISAVYDKDRNKNKEYTKKFKCKFSKNENNFFSKNFEICYISTDSGSHYKNIKKCFKFNKHVVVEKPPVLKTSQLILLNKIAKKKKLFFYAIYQNRENKSVKFVKNFLKKNKERIVLVNLKLLWSRPQKYYSRWHGKWKTDGGVIAQQGIHYIDLLCFLFGKPLTAVSLTKNISNKLQAEDTHLGLIKFQNANCIFGLTTSLRPNDLSALIEIYLQKKVIILSGLCCNEVLIKSYDNQKQEHFKRISKKKF